MATSQAYQCLDIVNLQIMLACPSYPLSFSSPLYLFLFPRYNLLLIDPESGKGPTGSSSPGVYKLYFEGFQGPMEDYPEYEQIDGLSSSKSKFQQCHFGLLNSTGVTYECVTKKFPVLKECWEITKSSSPSFKEDETAPERGNQLT